MKKENIEQKVIQKLKNIQDIELPVSIYDLGLIYKTDVELKDENVYVNIETTMINSRCNSTYSFSEEIVNQIKSIDEVDDCNVKFVYSPKWDVSMISQKGLEQLQSANSKCM
ncbi:metal-sulfur cluster assembly factor [Arcobacter sp. YIC-464]|uniref:metal-sulfur cluster assembly factor n=1 Tax=Arcobacter sp. YIC-464 TaxID=3376631 RepID=UPI003C1B260A